MADEFNRLLSVFEDRQRSFESSFREFKGEMKAELTDKTSKMETAAKEMMTSVHSIDKSLTKLEAADLPERFAILEERITNLEHWKYWLMGGIGVLGAVVTLLTTILIKKLV